MTNIDTEREAAMAEGNRIYKQPSDVDAFVQGWGWGGWVEDD